MTIFSDYRVMQGELRGGSPRCISYSMILLANSISPIPISYKYRVGIRNPRILSDQPKPTRYVVDTENQNSTSYPFYAIQQHPDEDIPKLQCVRYRTSEGRPTMANRSNNPQRRQTKKNSAEEAKSLGGSPCFLSVSFYKTKFNFLQSPLSLRQQASRKTHEEKKKKKTPATVPKKYGPFCPASLSNEQVHSVEATEPETWVLKRPKLSDGAGIVLCTVSFEASRWTPEENFEVVDDRWVC